ncbi:hypothetical protein [Microbacterium invictum]|uniref:Uncharacterized protein n=1 Tax=Microbacterium invictum TaxID=515415 RepID=A0AA40SQZ2_9MICO|nr:MULTISPECIES: hypothetical protein [Microbacterium]MBB4140766.1 hypothetical protein [Microbacterium invictum]
MKFFAALTGVGALLSNPALLLGLFLMVIAAMSWAGTTIGRESGWTTVFSVGAVLLLWLTPPTMFVASLAHTEREYQRARRDEVRRTLRRGRFPSAFGAALVGLLAPALVLMILLGFIANAACERGDMSASLAFAWSPLGTFARILAPSFGMSNAITC